MAKPGSFASSSLWKREFSSSAISPGFSASTTRSASGPMQSLGEGDRPLAERRGSAGTSGFSESAGPACPWAGRNARARRRARPCRRVRGWSAPAARCASRRSTRPSFTGTLRSARTSTRLFFTSTRSMVANVVTRFSWMRHASLVGTQGMRATSIPSSASAVEFGVGCLAVNAARLRLALVDLARFVGEARADILAIGLDIAAHLLKARRNSAGESAAVPAVRRRRRGGWRAPPRRAISATLGAIGAFSILLEPHSGHAISPRACWRV